MTALDCHHAWVNSATDYLALDDDALLQAQALNEQLKMMLIQQEAAMQEQLDSSAAAASPAAKASPTSSATHHTVNIFCIQTRPLL